MVMRHFFICHNAGGRCENSKELETKDEQCLKN